MPQTAQFASLHKGPVTARDRRRQSTGVIPDGVSDRRHSHKLGSDDVARRSSGHTLLPPVPLDTPGSRTPRGQSPARTEFQVEIGTKRGGSKQTPSVATQQRSISHTPRLNHPADNPGVVAPALTRGLDDAGKSRTTPPTPASSSQTPGLMEAWTSPSGSAGKAFAAPSAPIEAQVDAGAGTPRASLPGRQTRADTQSAVFHACDFDQNGYLDLKEMTWFADMIGFEGSASEFAMLYEKFCAKYSENEHNGLSLQNFVQFTDSADSDGMYLTTKQLRKLLMKPGFKHGAAMVRRYSGQSAASKVMQKRRSTWQSGIEALSTQSGTDSAAEGKSPNRNDNQIYSRAGQYFDQDQKAGGAEHSLSKIASATPMSYQIAVMLSKKHGISADQVRQRWGEFRVFKLNKNGELSKKEFAQVVREICDIPSNEVVPPYLLDDWWISTGRGINHALDFEGYLSWCLVHQFCEEMMIPDAGERDARNLARKLGCNILDIDNIKTIFKRFDINGSGVIEQDEFQQVVMSLMEVKRAEDVPPKVLTRFWREADRDGSGVIDFQEFAEWYVRVQQGEISWVVS